MVTAIIPLIILFFILIVLIIASYQDLKTITIKREIIIALYLLVPAFLYTSNANYATAGICFIFTLITFSCLWFISQKGFGFGDVLVISALAWMLADFTILRAFLITMGVMSIPWGVFWLWRYKKDPDLESMWSGKKQKIPVEKLKPGMVLADDGFMQGLTEKQIKKIRREKTSLMVKKPMPFIPVVLFALVAIFAGVSHFI